MTTLPHPNRQPSFQIAAEQPNAAVAPTPLDERHGLHAVPDLPNTVVPAPERDEAAEAQSAYLAEYHRQRHIKDLSRQATMAAMNAALWRK